MFMTPWGFNVQSRLERTDPEQYGRGRGEEKICLGGGGRWTERDWTGRDQG